MSNIYKMFDAYHEHLDVIKELKLINGEDEYICPLCLRGFKKSEIAQLSMEDAPQMSLGGKKIAITCKDCNNKCGSSIDYHLINYINLKEKRKLLPGSDRKILITNLGEGKAIEGNLRIKTSNDADLIIPQAYYHSKTFKDKLDLLVKDKIIMIQNKNVKCDYNIVSLAAIKNAYIILFSRFGYTYLLDKYYDRFRELFINHKSGLILKGLWTIHDNIPVHDGIYLSGDNRYRGFFVIYSVSRIQTYRVMVYMPTPLISVEEAATIIHDESYKKGLCLNRLDSANYLTNLSNVLAIRKWVYSLE